MSTPDLPRQLLADRLARAALGVTTPVYLLLYLIALGDLSFDGAVRPVDAWLVPMADELWTRARVPFQFEAIAVIELPFVVWLVARCLALRPQLRTPADNGPTGRIAGLACGPRMLRSSVVYSAEPSGHGNRHCRHEHYDTARFHFAGDQRGDNLALCAAALHGSIRVSPVNGLSAGPNAGHCFLSITRR